MLIKVSSTAAPFKVSLAVTSPAVPPTTPSTGAVVKSFTTASIQLTIIVNAEDSVEQPFPSDTV